MDPDTHKSDQPNAHDPRGVSIPHRDQTVSVPDRTQAAAANVLRGQIDTIYQTNPPNESVVEQQAPQQNPYERTHDSAPHNYNWNQYHSAWQQYYQQYYQRYYIQQLHIQRQQQAATKAKEAAQPLDHKTQTLTGIDPEAEKREQTAKEPTAAQVYKKQLLGKVSERAKKVRHSHHFMPIVSAFVVGFIFLFLQFNQLLFAQVHTYVSPGSITNDSIIVDPAASSKVGPNPELIIPKLNVDVPVVYGIQSLDDATVQQALHGGVVHYPLPGANAVPGQNGNTVILGHSSNDVFDSGAYKFAFVLLDRLEKDDVFYLNYQGTRYVYRVTGKQVISPTDLAAIQTSTTKPTATLVTCTPPGTALNRLLVTADQISPDPSGATAAPTTVATKSPSTIAAGNSPTLLERLFSLFTH